MPSSRLLPRPVVARRRSGRRLILITGTPGTGKRPLGGYLELQRGFVHLDFDSRRTRSRFLRGGEPELRSELAEVMASHPKVVVTWTYTSETQLAYVEMLRSMGFEWIWMDSDRGAAYDSVVAASASIRPPRFLDGFEADGGFRALESVLDELRRRRPFPRPKRPRVRVAVPSLQRPAWAGVAAFAVAAAAASVAYVTGAIAPSPSQPSRAALAHRAVHHAAVPTRGVLVVGKSLAGVALGATAADVRAQWGHRYTVCQGCTPRTWFFFDSPTSDAGVAVSFRHGRVTSVFTLGSPDGWHTTDGLRVGQIFDTFNDPAGKTTACSGYGAISTRSGNAVTSILTQGQAVYGFALSRPSEPICH
jgi:hypothetical protein